MHSLHLFIDKRLERRFNFVAVLIRDDVQMKVAVADVAVAAHSLDKSGLLQSRLHARIDHAVLDDFDELVHVL